MSDVASTAVLARNQPGYLSGIYRNLEANLRSVQGAAIESAMKTRTRISRKSDDNTITNTRETSNDAASHEKSTNTASPTSHATTRKKGSSKEKDGRHNPKHSVACEELGNANDPLLTPSRDTTSSRDNRYCDLKSDSASLKNCNGQKSRNLDLVVRRMLKAKKGDEERSISCEASEIKSNASEIKTLSNHRQPIAASVSQIGEDEYDTKRRRSSDSITAEGMIDVQRPVENLLADSEQTRVLHRDSPHRESSPDFSPHSSCSDNELTKPFVSPKPTGSSRQNEDGKAENMTMSTLIKQEPLALTETHAEIYRRGREASHSPASSYNSAHSAGQRSPSPKSPFEHHDDSHNNVEMMRQLVSQNQMSLVNPMRAQQLHQELLENAAFGRRTSSGGSPQPDTRPRPYHEDIAGVTAAALAAKGVGPPTLVPASSAIPSEAYSNFMLQSHPSYRDANIYQHAFMNPHREGANPTGIRVSPTAPVGRTPTRGIIGHKEAAAAAGENQSARRNGGTADGKCSYKRPPHTYPALIASAILDSPGNLITLRGIYDYIMNNFPYYKFGHDKSAWQNSIRHNLSLNQCFIKVPRYENAAKSNFWTMTREGFEEFGNENSFKRRRRRGATLAPISAYKNKKANAINECSRGKQREVLDKKLVWHSRSHTPEPRLDYQQAIDSSNKVLKRPCSPSADQQNGSKNPRMMVLKHGEGPSLEGIGYKTDGQPQRPNSLSSVEEMQVNVNTFTKSLSAATDSRDSIRPNAERSSPMESFKQQWIMAAAMHKNFGLFPPAMLHDFNTSTVAANGAKERYTDSDDVKMSSANTRGMKIPLLLDGVEIGSRTPLYYDSMGPGSKWTYDCKFCDHKHVDETANLLEQHCQLLHPMEFPNARAKLTTSRRNSDQNAERISPVGRQELHNGTSLANMGWPPSILAAAASYNAQNFIAAAQNSGMNLPMSYADTFATSSATPFDSLTRALAQQLNPNDAARSNAESLRRLPLMGASEVMQQGGSFPKSGDLSSMTQEHLRQLLYHQFMPQNPFFPGSTSSMPRPVPGAGAHGNDVSDIAQKFLLYHQKMLELAAQNTGDKQDKDDANMTARKPANLQPSPKSSHDETTHYYGTTHKASDEQSRDETRKNPAFCHQETKDAVTTCDQSINMKNLRKCVSPEQLSKHECVFEEARPATQPSTSHASTSTQTTGEDSKRMCIYCDITFSDDTMHALHMTCHDHNDPYRCTICGQDCHEKYYFNVHLLRGLHQPSASSEGHVKVNRDDSEAPPTGKESHVNRDNLTSCVVNGMEKKE